VCSTGFGDPAGLKYRVTSPQTLRTFEKPHFARILINPHDNGNRGYEHAFFKPYQADFTQKNTPQACAHRGVSARWTTPCRLLLLQVELLVLDAISRARKQKMKTMTQVFLLGRPRLFECLSWCS